MLGVVVLGVTSWGWTWGTVSSPTTPSTIEARAAGTEGTAVLTRAEDPEARVTDERLVSKAEDTADADPWTGTSRPSGLTAPTVRPAPASQLRTAPIAALDGPNRLAN